jgi:ribonuclease P protein component
LGEEIPNSNKNLRAKRKADKTFGPVRRLKKRQDFLRVQAQGEKFRTKHFLLSLVRENDPKHYTAQSRLGVTVTKKVDKRAVKRNQIKRRVREIWRLRRSKFQIKADMVVIALQGAAELDYGQINRQLTYLFYSSKLLKERKSNKKLKSA